MLNKTFNILVILFLSFSAMAMVKENDSLMQTLSQKPDSDYVKALYQNGRELMRKKEYRKALQHFTRGLTLSDSINFIRFLPDLYFQAGICYRRIENYEESIRYLQRSYTLAQEKNDSTKMANAQISIANTYLVMDDADNMIKYTYPALSYFKKANAPEGLSRAHNTLAIAYNIKYVLDSAEYHYLRSLECYAILKDEDGISTVYSNLAMVMMDKKDYNKALSYSMYSYNTDVKLYGECTNFQLNSNVGEIYLRMNDFKNALLWERKAYRMAQKTGSNDFIKTATDLLSAIFEKTGRYDSALYYFEKSREMNAILRVNNTIDGLTHLEEQFTAELKEKEISMLEKDKELKELIIAEHNESIVRNKILLIAGGIGFIFLFLGGFQINRLTRQKKKNYTALLELKKNIEKEKIQIEEKNKFILTNIALASRSQQQTLHNSKHLLSVFSDAFYLNIPKDRISGDFMWVKNSGSKTILCSADCTGHGVPGGLTSMHAFYILEDVCRPIPETAADALNLVNNKVLQLIPVSEKESTKFGMDASVIVIDTSKHTLSYSGANSAIIIVRKGELITLTPDKVTIGSKKHIFANNELPLEDGDRIFLFTDGFADQPGGEKKKKYMRSAFYQLLMETSDCSAKQQRDRLKEKIESWKGKLEQADDIQVIGIHYTFNKEV